MYVCVCNAINDRKVKDILSRTPVDTPAGLHRAAGCKPQCGRCLPDMAEMIRAARAEASTGVSLACALARAAD